MRVIMTGGGTGGHIYPAIAIADEIRKHDKNADILFVGTAAGLEKDIVPKNGYEIKFIEAGGFNRKNMFKNIEVAKKLRRGNMRSKEILREFKPDFVIGTGGYASAPVVKMAQKLKIPTFVHEQNAIPGMANKLLEKNVKNVFLGFEEASKYFKYKEKHIVTGNPVRSGFADISKEEARKDLGFKSKDFVLLAFGGSRGAGRINKAMLSVIEAFNGVRDFKICLATGSYYYDAIINELRDKGIKIEKNIHIMEYIHDMAKYLAASDLIISRSGALTVAEVTVCGKPAIFIPSTIVTGNHQYYNALAVSEKGGAIVTEEKDLDNEELISQILKLKNNRELLKDISQKSLKCAPQNAAGIICDTVMDLDIR